MPALAQVYAQLESIGVPTPHWGWHDHTDGAAAHELVQVEDGIEIRGKRINKPFVEKPVDAEDHNVYVYYPDSVGGGSKRLFRKVADQSSQFYPGENSLRTDGAYIYEEFLPTEGTDVKVYTVGPNYAYAEARKSPTLDGRVVRNQAGKEVRYPVLLTGTEKELARRIVIGFGQVRIAPW